MRTPQWTRTDRDVAGKMGWGLCSPVGWNGPYIFNLGEKFPSDEMAARRVVEIATHNRKATGRQYLACSKALLLCALG